MTLNLHEIAELTGSEFHGNTLSFQGISIDTRTLKPGETFLCLKGEHLDGHDFIKQAEEAGASSIVLSSKIKTKLPYILTEDTFVFLNRLADFKRDNYLGKVICLTGSNGKTTTKDLTAQILGKDKAIHKTLGNKNNQIGLPLTLLELNQQDFSVIEIGTNSMGEISYLSQKAKPHVALITNAHNSHLEGLVDVDSVAKEKGDIIDSLNGEGSIVLPSDSPYFKYWKDRSKGLKIISFGKSDSSTLRVTYISQEVKNNKILFGIKIGNLDLDCSLNTIGEHNVLNAIAALGACYALDLDINKCIKDLENCKFPDRRLSLKDYINGGTLIDDSYNSNPESMKNLVSLVTNEKRKKVLIAGEMLELGNNAEEFHKEVCLFASEKIDYFLCIGEMWRKGLEHYSGNGRIFRSKEDLLKHLNKIPLEDPIIMVKGSRSTKMNEIADKLTK